MTKKTRQRVEPVLVVVKPDGMRRGLAGRVLDGFCRSDLTLVALQMAEITPRLIKEHYSHLKSKPFYGELIDFWVKADEQRVLAMVYSGPNAIRKSRKLAGATNPEEADPYSIRGAYGRITTGGVFENVLHVSSSASEARREIKLWFGPRSIRNSFKMLQPWLT